MKDASMSLGIYFEIKDAELYGGEGTTGYAATIVEISIEGLQNADFEKYANSQLEAMASMAKVPKEKVRIISKTEDDKLRYLLSKGTYTYSDLAAELRHSEGAIKRRILDLGINKKPVRCPPPKMDGGRGGNLVPHGRRRLRFYTNRREAEPDSAGHAWKIRAAAESGI